MMSRSCCPTPQRSREGFVVEGGSQFDFTRLGLTLQSTDSSTGSDSARIKSDGTFVIPNVFDGNYRVRGFRFSRRVLRQIGATRED